MIAHRQNPATLNTDDTPPYPLPGVVKILCRELAAAVDRGDYAYAESTRFALNALVESTPPSASVAAPAPVRPGHLTGAWPMPAGELRERMRSYFATVKPSAPGAEAEAHAARCGLAVIR